MPPDFRARFDDLELGLYVMRSVSGVKALDVFEPHQYTLFVSNSEKVFSKESLDTAFALFGSAINLGFDPEGRITLPADYRKYAGITDNVCFIGLGRHIQIWEPETGQAKQEEAFLSAIEKRESIKLPLVESQEAKA